MKLQDLFERQHKEKITEFLARHADDSNAFVHSTDTPKIGINTKFSDSHDSPIGLYAFKLKPFWDSVKDNDVYMKDIYQFFPYYGGQYTYIIKPTTQMTTAKSYTQKDLEQDTEKLKNLLNIDDRMITRLRSAARTNPNFVDMPIGYLWGMTKAIAGGFLMEFDDMTYVSTSKWGALLRKLGYDSFYDAGLGFIHGAEPSQALFLYPHTVDIVDVHQRHIRRPITLGNKTYQSMPKTVALPGIPNTFFYNNTDEDYQRVKRWHIENLDYLELRQLMSKRSATSKVHIKSLHFNFSRVTTSSQVLSDLLDRLSSDPNITVDRVTVGVNDRENDMQLYMRLNKLDRLSMPVYISIYDLPEQYFERLPDAVKSKITLYNPMRGLP